MYHRSRNILIVGLVIALLFGLKATSTDACGPLYSGTMLDKTDDELLKSPLADFRREIGRIKLSETPAFRAVQPEKSEAEQTATADLTDLQMALKIPAGNENDLLKKYALMRETIREHAKKMAEWKECKRWLTPEKMKEHPEPVLPQVAIPEGLPKDFHLYLSGAIEYHKGNTEAAVAKWKELLELPKEKRHYRSVWAAFMMGKTLLDSKPQEAAKWFARARELAKDGFADSLGLAASSFGWEAQAELKQKHYTRAIELYLDQHVTEDPTAAVSLRIVAGRVLNDNEESILVLAKHEVSRQVISAHLVSSIGPSDGYLGGERKTLVATWLKAIESANANNISGADRFAWMAYQSGDMKTSARWLEKAAKNSSIAQWLRAKLLLRDGKTDEAAVLLSEVVRTLPKEEKRDNEDVYLNDFYEGMSRCSRVAGELAVLRVLRNQYSEAMNLLLRAGFWIDAAYIAERVLTPEELVSYVDTNWPAPVKDKKDAEKDQGKEKAGLIETTNKIRHLLARRLTRLNRLDEARKYYPDDYLAKFDEYVKALQKGNDPGQSQEDRGKSLWEAAKTAHHNGTVLLETEIEPDWHTYGGFHNRGSFAQKRMEAGRNNKTASITTDEQERVEKNKMPVEKRHHYCFVAADIAWSAAQLMPNESDKTARVLCEAGTWIKYLDPEAADRFYKALVNRCRTTKLGQEADKLRWFPKLEGDK